MPTRWVYVAVGVALVLNLALLLWYQHYLGGDFPFQDEWGYVTRLRFLPTTGFSHYLFDKYQTYYMPVFLLVWYLFYALAHLDIMVIRYTGAVISALVALLLCIMLYRRAARINLPAFLLILCAPFIICSFNHWATYNQSIESVCEPLLFGVVLLTCWMADRSLRSSGGLGWTLLCVFGWLVASGIYAPGLALLPAIFTARLLLRRRIDRSLLLMGILIAAVLTEYVMRGQGLSNGRELPAFSFNDMGNLFMDWLGLTGNTLFSPRTASGQDFTRVLGVVILLIQAAATFHVLRLPGEQRKRFMIPLTLTLYNLIVFCEIIAARFHFQDVAFTPRYSVHMLGGPVSLLFWGVMLIDSVKWRRLLVATTLVIVVCGVAAADAQTSVALPYVRVTFTRVRTTLMSLQAEPSADQRAQMFVSPAMAPLVYPGRLFLEENHLAMYRNSTLTVPPSVLAANSANPAISNDDGFAVLNYGPKNIHAGSGFHVQPNGESALWIKMNREVQGKAYIVINGTQLRAAHRGDVVSAKVPASLYSQPGDYPMYVLEVNGAREIKSDPIQFVVQARCMKPVNADASANGGPAIPAQAGLEVLNWGPKNIRAGVGFHVQSNGESALWIKLNRQVQGKVYIVINATQLPAEHHADIVTAEIPPELYSQSISYSMYVLEVNCAQEMKSGLIQFVVH